MSSSLRVTLLALIFFALALPALAAPIFPSELVPCDGPDCNVCHLVEMGQRILNTLIGLGVFIGVLLFSYAGFLYITSGGSASNAQKAKQIFIDVAIGFILALSAWLLVNLIMNVFLDPKKAGVASSWNQVQCGTDLRPNSAAVKAAGLPELCETCGIGTPPVGTNVQGNANLAPQQQSVISNGQIVAVGCPGGCTNIPAGIQVKPGACSQVATCTMDTSLSKKMLGFHDGLKAAGIGLSDWQITEAYPPTVAHQNECHSKGTCVDINFVNKPNPTGLDIAAVQDAAASANMRAVYEVKTVAEKDALVAGGAHANDIQVVSAITGPHFSLYNVSLSN